uniref:hypothetical protein n=1 Tax=Streptomyces bohaiensis TaxID=1431344 RepID=UPI0030C6C502
IRGFVNPIIDLSTITPIQFPIAMIFQVSMMMMMMMMMMLVLQVRLLLHQKINLLMPDTTTRLIEST